MRTKRRGAASAEPTDHGTDTRTKDCALNKLRPLGEVSVEIGKLGAGHCLRLDPITEPTGIQAHRTATARYASCARDLRGASIATRRPATGSSWTFRGSNLPCCWLQQTFPSQRSRREQQELPEEEEAEEAQACRHRVCPSPSMRTTCPSERSDDRR